MGGQEALLVRLFEHVEAFGAKRVNATRKPLMQQHQVV